MKSILILFDNVVNLYIWVLIIHVIFSWLVAFNVLNSSNRFVYSILEISYKPPGTNEFLLDSMSAALYLLLKVNLKLFKLIFFK